MSKKTILFTVLMAVLLILVISCQAQPEAVEVTPPDVAEVPAEPEEVEAVEEIEPVEPVEEVEPAEEAETAVPAEPVDRTGAWVDSVVIVEEPSGDAAVSRLQAGDLDVYAYTIASPETAQKIMAADDLKYARSFGSYNELTFNPATCSDGRLNPFATPRIREAMNWAVDRDYIIDEIMGGLGVPRFVPVGAASADRGRFAAEIRQIEVEYAYDMDKAYAVISEEMEKLGATLENGVWTFNGQPVELTVLIRTEDERMQIGDYVANQLEDLGFTVTRNYKTGSEASPIWMSGDPPACDFHVYTGGWVTTAIALDEGPNFEFFYTPVGLPSPLWQAYTPSEEFAALANRLSTNDFTTLEERQALFAEALPLALQDSVRVWLLDRTSIAPYRQEVEVASDLSGSIYGTFLWPYTLRRTGEVGGTINWASSSILTEPWNPIAGSNWAYDLMVIRALGQIAAFPDPATGLYWPQRLESATITVQEGLPVAKTLDWLDLEFAPEITVPDDVWVDWDATEQRFLTAAEVYDEPQTALVKSVVTYPSELTSDITWHDGSTFDAADVVMRWILIFDRANPDSAIYDASEVPNFESFMSAFKGFKIASQDPLVIEYYSDWWQLDAENIVGVFGTNTSQWPWYPQGEGAWHTMALGVMAEADGQAAFSSDKAEEIQVEWLNYIAGPTLNILNEQLAVAAEAGMIPYEPTLGQFITAEEAAERYANLQQWYDDRGNFWVGTGPFYLKEAYPVEGTVILERYPDFPDPADKWAGFAEAAIAEAEVQGAGRVTIGEEAVFDVFVEFQGEPYAMTDIKQVQYLLFDAAGELVAVGEAEAVEDGLWQVILPAETTAGLEAGSSRLEVVVSSNLVALPSLSAFEFVAAP